MSSGGISRSEALALATSGADEQRRKALALAVGNGSGRTLSESIVSSARLDKGKTTPALGAGLMSTLSDEARAVVEKEMKLASEQLAKHLPHLLEQGGVTTEVPAMPDHVIGRTIEVGAISGSAGMIGRDMEDRLLRIETAGEIVPAAPRQPARERSKSKSAKRKSRRRASAPELIAQRAVRRHRKAARVMLSRLDLSTELKELTDLEAELTKGTPQACKHASYRARNLLEGLADCLFPPTSRTRKGRDGRKHSLGSKDFKNRLIAYVEKQLKGKLEGHEFRAFVATLDTVMRWTGSGPHGAYDPHEAEHMYPRLLDALAVLARAHDGE